MEKKQRYKITYPPAKAFLKAITPKNKNLSKKDISRFEQKLYQFDYAYYKNSTDTLFDRSYGNEKAHQKLLLERDVPTLRFHGALYLDTYKKGLHNKEAFEWASSYLYLGAQEGDPFCQELLGQLLLLNNTSEQASIFHQKYLVPTKAEEYFRMAAQPRTFINPFTQQHETLSCTGSNQIWKLPHSATRLRAYATWQFSPALETQKNVYVEPKVALQAIWNNTTKEEVSHSNEQKICKVILEKSNPPKPPVKNKKALYLTLLKEAEKGKPHAIYAQALFAKKFSLKKEYKEKMLSWIEKLVAIPKATQFRKKAISLIEDIPDCEKTFSILSFLCSIYASGIHEIEPSLNKVEQYASTLVQQHRNKKKMHALFNMGLLQKCLPLAQTSQTVSELCYAIVEAACDGVCEHAEKLFSNKKISLPHIIKLISENQKLNSKPEILLLEADFQIKQHQYTAALPLLIAALNAANKQNKMLIKKIVTAHLTTLESLNIDLSESKPVLQQHKIYGFCITNNDVITAINNPQKRIAQQAAHTFVKHPAFIKLLENKDLNVQYHLALWLTTHQEYIQDAIVKKNTIIQQLADEAFVPAQLHLIALTRANLSGNNLDEYLTRFKQVLPKLSTSLFELYPTCYSELKQCIETVAKNADTHPDAAYIYGQILEYGIATLNKQPEQAYKYYKKALKLGIANEDRITALNYIENFLTEINPNTQLDKYINEHLFLISYHSKHKNSQKLIKYLSSLTNLPLEETIFRTQLIPLLQKIDLIQIADKSALEGNWHDAMDYIRFLIESTHVLSIKKEDSVSALQACKNISKLLLKWKLTTEKTIYNLPENAGEFIHDFMGELCNIMGYLHYYKLNNKEDAIKALSTGSSIYNNAKSHYSLANIKIESGNFNEGLKLLDKAAEQNNIQALEILAEFHIYGPYLCSIISDDFIYDYKQGFKELAKAALLGSQKAKTLLPLLRKPKEVCNKPLDSNDTKTCYEYGQFLFENGDYENAATWFEHVPNEAIAQARFYKAMLALYQVKKNIGTTELLDKASNLLSAVVQHRKELTKNPESNQFTGLSMRGLLYLAFKHNHIPSLLSATEYITTLIEYRSNPVWRKALPMLTKKMQTHCAEEKYEKVVDLFIARALNVVELHDDYKLWVALGDLILKRPHLSYLSPEGSLNAVEKAILFYSSIPLQDKENKIYKDISVIKAKLCISKINGLIVLHPHNPERYPLREAEELYNSVLQDQKKYRFNVANELAEAHFLLKELKKKKK